MVISYNKLWKLLIDKSMNKNTLRTNGVNAATIAKMGKNEYVSMETLVRIC
jgi:DNA-binding Xre family transcriptional regulator